METATASNGSAAGSKNGATASAAAANLSPLSGVDTGILLEAGTNEAEVLVFRIRDSRFGVNVAKVREVLPIERVTQMPKSHGAVDGLVEIRDYVVPLVNLERYLYDSVIEIENNTNESLLLLEYNRQHVAFRVSAVERIFRVSWKDTLPTPQLGDEPAPFTSVLRQPDGLVPLIDFESISAVIGIGGRRASVSDPNEQTSLDRAMQSIVFADDSRMISEMVKDSLVEAGFRNLHGFPDGENAWEYLNEIAKNETAESIQTKVSCVVTDIEMPAMDGLSLTRNIRQHPVLRSIPVIIFSSIASDDNAKKGQQVGATAQVAKPCYDDLLNTLTQIVDEQKRGM